MTITKLFVRPVAVMAVVLAMNVPELRATPIMSEGWDTVGSVNGWNDTVTDDVTLGNTAHYLSIAFAAETVPLPGGDIIRTGTGSADGLTGDYAAASINSVGFRFMTDQYSPDGLALYFGSSSHRVWSLALAAPPTNAWTTYNVSLDYTAGWIGGPGADAAAFASDLSAVDWIGVYIDRTYGGCAAPPAQNYALDDFTAYTETPEPETYVLLLAALIPLGVIFREKFGPRSVIV